MRRLMVLAMVTGLAGCGANSPQELRAETQGQSEFVMRGDFNGMVAAVDRGAAKCFHGKNVQMRRTYVGRSIAEDGGTDITIFQFGVFDPIFFAHIGIYDLGEDRLRIKISQTSQMPDQLPDLVKSWAGGIFVCELN